jgi:hypothetical protein
MNTALKIGAAGALTFAGVAAHASVATPASGAADAILFGEVLNTNSSVVASFAGDTGISINSLLGGGVNTTVLGSDANLAKLFAADASDDTIYWGVQAAQGTTTATPQFLTTAAKPSRLATLPNADVAGPTSTWAVGFNNDISTLNSNLGPNATTIEGATAAKAGVWDVTGNGTANWYGSLTTSNTLATAASVGTGQLFSVVASSGSNPTYGAVENLSFSATGLTFAGSGGSPPPVPLPAAVWLLGSGLLGLTGVARRKLKA